MKTDIKTVAYLYDIYSTHDMYVTVTIMKKKLIGYNHTQCSSLQHNIVMNLYLKRFLQ